MPGVSRPERSTHFPTAAKSDTPVDRGSRAPARRASGRGRPRTPVRQHRRVLLGGRALLLKYVPVRWFSQCFHAPTADQSTRRVTSSTPTRRATRPVLVRAVPERESALDGRLVCRSQRLPRGVHRSSLRGLRGLSRLSSAFFDAFEQVVDAGTTPETELSLEATFVEWAKTEIAGRGLEPGVPYEHTWSCYRDGSPACSTCVSCVYRLEASQQAGARDSVEYAGRRRSGT